MTIGKEVYAREIYAGVSSPTMAKGSDRLPSYVNNANSLNKDISVNNEVIDILKPCNNKARDNFNPSNSISYQNEELATDCLNCEADNALSASLKNNASFKNNTPLTVKSVRLSFQMMTRAEPVEMVIATIKTLLKIKAPDDEILIVDNNNTETALYEPLAKFCAGLDAQLNVRFYHIDAVAGFKAGALNLALGLMDPRCTHLVVVDSDYQALPQARKSIAAAINSYPNHALLQFPQFYRDTGRDDVHSELNHYFNYHLYRSFNRKRALSTGTYAIIRRDALLHLGGWSGASITEDAQMGVLMHGHGLRSRFIPEVIATGLLPNTLGDLMSQRRRWIYGNMQVLNTYSSIRPSAPMSAAVPYLATNSVELSKLAVELSKSNSLSERLAYIRAHLSQLSAWINFTGIFILLHICTLLIIAGALLMDVSINLTSLLTPLYVVYAGYGLFLARRLWAYSQDSAPLNQQVNRADAPRFYERLRAWLLHLNFWELGALSWLPVLWGQDKPFICTPKYEVIRTRRTVMAANLAALPKLLLVLNIVTAIIVAPFSPLYSPLLFGCALVVLVLKLWAAKVIFANYPYTDKRGVGQSVSIDTDEPLIRLNTSNESTQNRCSSRTEKPLTALFKDNKM
ncbi:glycosyltransferase [Psychrobacter frigidicola]|uniref:Glycosyltransferase n=1 Tax=Psychrobacter frigidicola TaxID=45611 RepID=A0A5C7A6V8_9GAMM|nr:glycosyltransferase family 2 protein [Psychrobacter frigidicola]TXD98435.1 glycosyltransferase [Psychrobacter frigidicola]